MLARQAEWIWMAFGRIYFAGLTDNLPVRHRPQLSMTFIPDAASLPALASLNGEEHIRSIHLLMALVEKPKLARCDGLWPLLTLAQSQLEACDRCWMRNRMNVRKCSAKPS